MNYGQAELQLLFVLDNVKAKGAMDQNAVVSRAPAQLRSGMVKLDSPSTSRPLRPLL